MGRQGRGRVGVLPLEVCVGMAVGDRLGLSVFALIGLDVDTVIVGKGFDACSDCKVAAIGFGVAVRALVGKTKGLFESYCPWRRPGAAGLATEAVASGDGQDEEGG